MGSSIDAGVFAFGENFVGDFGGAEAGVVDESFFAKQVHGPGAEGPGRSAVAGGLFAGEEADAGDGLVEEAFFFGAAVEARRVFVDPAVNADFVAAALQDLGNELGVDEGVDAGDEEGGGDIVAVEDGEEAGCAGLRAVVGGGERGGRGDAIAEEGRLGVVVEGEQDGDAGVIGPGRREFGTHGDGVDGVKDFLVGPEGAGLGDGLGLVGILGVER